MSANHCYEHNFTSTDGGRCPGCADAQEQRLRAELASLRSQLAAAQDASKYTSEDMKRVLDERDAAQARADALAEAVRHGVEEYGCDWCASQEPDFDTHQAPHHPDCPIGAALSSPRARRDSARARSDMALCPFRKKLLAAIDKAWPEFMWRSCTDKKTGSLDVVGEQLSGWKLDMEIEGPKAGGTWAIIVVRYCGGPLHEIPEGAALRLARRYLRERKS